MTQPLRAGRGIWARLILLISAFLAGTGATYAASTWTPLTNMAPSPDGVQLMIQMTDGTILVQSYNGQDWMKLTPDSNGSYINGAWTFVASGSVARLYFASQVLPDGPLWTTGGESSGPGLLPNWSNTGEIYDPVANTWAITAPFPNQASCPTLNYASGNLTSGSAVVTNIYPYTTGFVVGWRVTGNGVPANTIILSVDSPSQITPSHAATATRTGSERDFNHSYRLTGFFGDEPSILVDGGKNLVGDLVNANSYVYDPETNSWTLSGAASRRQLPALCERRRNLLFPDRDCDYTS